VAKEGVFGLQKETSELREHIKKGEAKLDKA
jgi:hypothetical protein